MCKQPAVYILASEQNGTLYVGVTSDLKTNLGRQKQSGWRLLEKIQRSRPGLLRVAREHGVGDYTGEADKEMEPPGSAGSDRETELGLEGFVGRDYLGNEH
jgi:hypothetical protein